MRRALRLLHRHSGLAGPAGGILHVRGGSLENLVCMVAWKQPSACSIAPTRLRPPWRQVCPEKMAWRVGADLCISISQVCLEKIARMQEKNLAAMLVQVSNTLGNGTQSMQPPCLSRLPRRDTP